MYKTANAYYRETFGCKVYKLSLDGGFTCPNRDGRVGWGGCIFCSAMGSGEFAARGEDPVYQPLPKFPAVTRDIAVVCDKAVTVGALVDCIRRGAKGLLKDVALFDIYTGTGIPEGKKSVAFNLTLRADDRSLTAEEADADVKSILDLLASELNAVLR
jgi:phenylalanyl-tRNA synthetase beta chain